MPAQSGSIHVEGLDEFRSGLKHSTNPRAYKTALKVEEAVIATEVAARARGIASGMGGPFAHFAGDISGTATAKGASIRVAAEANAAFWGAKQHSGWYGEPQYDDGPPNLPPWVGAGWDVVAGQGPYAIVPAIVEAEPEILRRYGNAIDHVTAQAFPPTGGITF